MDNWILKPGIYERVVIIEDMLKDKLVKDTINWIRRAKRWEILPQVENLHVTIAKTANYPYQFNSWDNVVKEKVPKKNNQRINQENPSSPPDRVLRLA